MKRSHKPGVETKSAILDAFIALCAEEGVSQVTLQKVARRAKLAFGTVRYHFAVQGTNLEYEASLQVAKQGQLFTQNSIEAARKRRDFHPLKAYVDATFDWIETYPDHAKFLLYFYYVSGTKQQLPIRNDQLVATARLRTVSLLHEAIGSGKYRTGLNVQDLAPKIHTVLFGCGVMAMSISTSEEFKRQRIACWQMIECLLSHKH